MTQVNITTKVDEAVETQPLHSSGDDVNHDNNDHAAAGNHHHRMICNHLDNGGKAKEPQKQSSST